ncbi:MAG TPA: C25 family cysteine peptidase [Anaerolineales bacterium]|nr:C25 family cysteine peptidase [Anaerolineales bacterium]
MIDRDTLFHIFGAARASGRPDFARSLAADWLARWPHDLEVQFVMAQVEVDQGDAKSAARRLRQVIATDPEYVEAYDLLGTAARASGDPLRASLAEACGRVLRKVDTPDAEGPAWLAHLATALASLGSGDPQRAAREAQDALLLDPDVPLPSLVLMRALEASGEHLAAVATARAAHDRWPECVAFTLSLAEDLIDRNEHARAVEYLHRAAANDPTGRVALRLLGSDHPYRSLWSDSFQADVSRPIPAEVAAVLGDNRLAGASPAAHDVPTAATAGMATVGTAGSSPPVAETAFGAAVAFAGSSAAEDEVSPAGMPPDAAGIDDGPEPRPEPWESFRGPDSGDGKGGESPELEKVRADFNRMAARLRVAEASADFERRQPAYIVLSSRTRLLQRFGPDRFDRLDEAMADLVEAVQTRPGWSAYAFFPDDPASLKSFGLTPIDPGNAWQVKLRLNDLDRALAKRGEMIGAVLIIGGNRVVPFHTLPNPTDDDDQAVASDNPYSTSDENYLAPEWPVGRLPVEDDVDPLVKILREAAVQHAWSSRPMGLLERFRTWLRGGMGRLFGSRPRSLGYSASIWRKASMAVFRAIGDPQSMVTSPPATVGSLPAEAVRPSTLSYYNLHGIEDGPEWFGHRDPLRDTDVDTEFPVALRPQDIVNGGRAPKIVFSEACYGAHVEDRTADDAIALKFLASGSQAVVGSTEISYGSVTPPLIGADLLGRYFWDQLNLGLPVGEALRRAKLSLVAEMHRRQGFLDGEDQKTLISFVLYGDPLYIAFPLPRGTTAKAPARPAGRPKDIKVACALGSPSIPVAELQPETYDRVKSIVAQYLPGLENASAQIHAQHCGCDGQGHACPCSQLGLKGLPAETEQTMVVTLSKQIPDGGRRHVHFARLTLDSTGKVLKLAVSR